MKRILLGLLIALLAFACGLGVASLGRTKTVSAEPQLCSAPKKSAVVLSGDSAGQTVDDLGNLIDDKYVAKFNGKKLNLKYDSGGGDLSEAISGANVIALNDGGLLISVSDTLYRLDLVRQTRWRYSTSQIVFSFAFVVATNMVYLTAGDNNMFILDADNGRELHAESRNGSAAYGVAENYGEDMCLVKDNFGGYRDKFRDDGLEPMKDGITCWRGTRELWHADFPPDAELVVKGKRILAVTRSKSGIYVKEIAVPQR